MSRQGLDTHQDSHGNHKQTQRTEETTSAIIRYVPTGYYFGTLVDGKRAGTGIINLQNPRGYYQGELIDDLMHGIGLLELSGKPTYLGCFRAGIPEGVGRQVSQQYSHVGTFVDGEPNGVGETVIQSGIRIISTFTSSGMRGYGEIQDTSNQIKVRGTFAEGKLEGLAIKIGPKAKYFGNFRNGVKLGPGVLYDNTGNLLSACLYVNGSSVRYGVFPLMDYEGQVDDTAQPEGWGKQSNGYIGEYSRGLQHGFGRLSQTDGSFTYTGNWVNSTMEGMGYLQTDTENYFGHFKRGKRDGLGYEVTSKSNREYLGYFVNGAKHGVALVRIPGKEEKCARFVSNKLVEILSESQGIELRKSSNLDFRSFANSSSLKLRQMMGFFQEQRQALQGLHQKDTVAFLEQKFEENHAELEYSIQEIKAKHEEIKDSFDLLRCDLTESLIHNTSGKPSSQTVRGDSISRIRADEFQKYKDYLLQLESAPFYYPTEESEQSQPEWKLPQASQPAEIELSAFSFDKEFGNLALATGGLLDSSPSKRGHMSRQTLGHISQNPSMLSPNQRHTNSKSRESSRDFVDGAAKSKQVETFREPKSIRLNYRSFQNGLLDSAFPSNLEDYGKFEGYRMHSFNVSGRTVSLPLLFSPEKSTTQYFANDSRMVNHHQHSMPQIAEDPLDRVDFSTPYRKSASVDHYIGLIDRLEAPQASQSTDRLLKASNNAVQRHLREEGPDEPVPSKTQITEVPKEKPSTRLEIPKPSDHSNVNQGEVSSRTLEQFEFDPLGLPPPPASKQRVESLNEVSEPVQVRSVEGRPPEGRDYSQVSENYEQPTGMDQTNGGKHSQTRQFPPAPSEPSKNSTNMNRHSDEQDQNANDRTHTEESPPKSVGQPTPTSKELLEERSRLEKLKIQLEIELLKVQLEAVQKEKQIYEGKPTNGDGLGYTYQTP